jgi:hypothetical protein
MTFFYKCIKNLGLDPDPDWIPIQQQPGSGSRLNLDPKHWLFAPFFLFLSIDMQRRPVELVFFSTAEFFVVRCRVKIKISILGILHGL